MNLTLIGLHISCSAITSPFFNFPSSHSSPKNLIAFSNFNFNKHFSSLFHNQLTNKMNSRLDFTLSFSKMSNFLSQVVAFTSDDDAIEIDGKSDVYAASATSPTTSFNCFSCSFKNNRIPNEMKDNDEMPKSTAGAAIYVSLPYAITANITHSNFTKNSAPFGGAIFYGSSSGSLIINHCVFTENSCFGQGSHIYIGTHENLSLANINFILGEGNTSVYIIAKEGMEDLELNEIRFYQNEGPILVENAQDVTFTACCFTKFTGSGNSIQYIPENLISEHGSAKKIIIKNSCVNYGVAPDLTLTPGSIASAFKSIQEDNETYCAGCRLVPTPSHTMSARVSLACAKEAIIAICCCVFVSILGILVVIGMRKNSTMGESVDRSEKIYN